MQTLWRVKKAKDVLSAIGLAMILKYYYSAVVDGRFVKKLLRCAFTACYH
jgi:hypothetical protein